MYDHEHPAYKKLQEIGREITGKVKPRAVVVFSAHWQGGRDMVEVNTAEVTELIYEYASSQSLVRSQKKKCGAVLTSLASMVSPGIIIRRSTPT